MSIIKSFNSFFEIDPKDIPSYSDKMWQLFTSKVKNNKEMIILMEKWNHYYDMCYLGDELKDLDGKIFKEMIGFEKSEITPDMLNWDFSRRSRNYYYEDLFKREVYTLDEKRFHPNTQQRMKKYWWKLRDVLLEGIKFEEVSPLVSKVQGLEYDETLFANNFCESILVYNQSDEWKSYQNFYKEEKLQPDISVTEIFRINVGAKFALNQYNKNYKQGTILLMWLIDNAIQSLRKQKAA